MNRQKFLFLLLFFLLGSSFGKAQSLIVTGKVTDSEGIEVVGAGITIKGVKGLGSTSDINGQYSINVADPAKSVLVFSYLGMKDKEVSVNGRNVINVVMEADAMMLEEVVAVGYATMKRKDLTGSVASVGGEELSKVPTSDITQALVGRMAGVMVTQSEGSPDAGISIRVRGGISITQSNEPLYIIDGFPTEDGLSSLDPNEIETIDILKDAASTAIYGARGANGVVVVTTKTGGKKGRTNVSFDTYVGVRKLAKKLDVLSPYEYALADYERKVYEAKTDEKFNEGVAEFEAIYGKFSDLNANYANRKGIDWQEETLGRNAIVQNYRIGVDGGMENMHYNLAYSYFDEQGAMVHSGNKKHNITMSLSHKINKKLTVNARLNYDYRKIFGMGTSGDGSGGTGDRFNKLQHILQYRPIIGIKGEDSELLGDEDALIMDESGNVMQNPLLSASAETNNRIRRTIQANGGFSYKILKGLTFSNTTGMRYQALRREIFYGEKSMLAKRSSINGSLSNYEYGSFQTSNVLTYNFKKNIHDLTVMAGQEWVSAWNQNFTASATNFPNDDIGLADLSLGRPAPASSYINHDDKLLSFFSRVNYSLKGRYIFSASVRADGSSKFGKNHKWGVFPAFSAAWRASEEPFIKDLGVFSDLKFRSGYGLAGNNRIASYQSLAIMGSVLYPDGNSNQSGYVPNQIPNPDLGWEANKTLNIGFDMGFLNQRIVISPEFYINRSSDLLLEAKIPSSSGHSSMLINAGETENRGIDLTINTINIATKDFSWKTSLTFSHNSNSVRNLAGDKVQLWEAAFGYSQKTHIVREGKPLGQFYGYVTDGIYNVSDFDYDAATNKYTLKDGIPYSGKKENVKPGDWKFKNIDGSEDNKITENDKTVIGNALPKFYGGINNTFLWRNWDMSIYITYNYGNDVFNATKLTNSRVGQVNRNALAFASSDNRFMTINAAGQKVTDPTELAALNKGKTFASVSDSEQGDMYVHSWAIEDGSYIKLNNVTIGYSLPKKIVKKVGINSLRLYATGSNLLTLTKYSGYDPEVSTFKSGLTQGVDFGGYPRSRSFVLGLNLTF